jgi:ribosomal protein L11 methyltransferase
VDEETGISFVRTPGEPSGWLEATIQFVNADDEDVGSFVADCMELGAVGSRETTAGIEAEVVEDEGCEACGASLYIQAYFPGSAGMRRIVNLLETRTRAMKGTSRSPEMRVRLLRLRRIEQKEWATRWKGGFPPEQVSKGFWVVPPWHRPSLPDGAIPMILEPGQAFGTGKHPTTRHCLEFLEEIAQIEDRLPPSFLDVGCGSGILSIAARRLGAARVVGLDIDPDALISARRNLGLNGLSRDILVVNGTLACCRGRFDLIAANLDAKTLLSHREPLTRAVIRGGLVILSGMLTEEAEGVLASFRTAGLRPMAEKTDCEEGWTSVLLKKAGR